jgi:hypothetical protein
MLDRFPSLLAASTFVVLSLSVTHEWGYYSQLDPHLQALVSPTDYFSSALLWLPYIAVTYFILAVLTVLQWRLEDFQFPRSGRHSKGYTVMGVTCLFLALVGFLTTPPHQAWSLYAVAGTFLWASIFLFVIDHHSVSKHLTASTAFVAIFFPIALMFSYSFGVYDGKSDLLRSEPKYGLVSKGVGILVFL